MWALLKSRLWLWAVLAVGAPVLSWLLGTVGDRLEQRYGPTTLSRALQKVRGWVSRRATGPFAPQGGALDAGPARP